MLIQQCLQDVNTTSLNVVIKHRVKRRCETVLATLMKFQNKKFLQFNTKTLTLNIFPTAKNNGVLKGKTAVMQSKAVLQKISVQIAAMKH